MKKTITKRQKMVKKIKKFAFENILDIFIVIIFLSLLIFFIIPKKTHIYLKGETEAIALESYSGEITFFSKFFGNNSINDIMGCVIQNTVPIEVEVNGKRFKLDFGELKIHMHSNKNNYMANIIEFDDIVSCAMKTFCSDVEIRNEQLFLAECSDNVLIDIQNSKEMKVEGVSTINLGDNVFFQLQGGSDCIKIFSDNTQCLRMFKMKNLTWNNIQNIRIEGCAIDIDTVIENAEYNMEQKILSEEQKIPYSEIVVNSSEGHAFNIKMKQTEIYVSGYMEQIFLDGENISMYGVNWLLGNYSVFLIGFSTYILIYSLELLRNKLKEYKKIRRKNEKGKK